MSKYAARDMQFAVGAAGTDVVGQVMSGLDAFGSSRELIDGSAYGDDWKDWVVGQQDGDTFTLGIAYDPEDSDHEGLITAYDAGEPDTFHAFQDSSTFHVKFPALITALSRGGARDGLLTLNVVFKVLSPGVEEVTS